MPWSLFDILLALPVYALVLFRLGGFMLTAPVFSSRVIPGRVRGAMVIALAAMIFPAVSRQAPTDMTLSAVLIGGAGELLIGMAIGLTLSVFLSGAAFGGMVAGQQAGLALGQVFDPSQNEQTTIIGQIFSMTLVVVFLLAGGHRAAVLAVLDTYRAMPLMSVELGEPVVLLLIEAITASFVFGIRLAAPTLIALFLVTTSLGFLSKTMPQLNILSVGFMVRLLVAMGVLGLTVSSCEELLIDHVWDALDAVRVAFGLDVSTNGLTS